MITELADIGCRGEVTGKKSDYDRDSALKFPSSRDHIDKVLDLD